MDKLLLEGLNSLHGDGSRKSDDSAGRKICMEVPPEKLREAASLMKVHGARLLTMAGVDERKINGHFGVYMVFALPSGKVAELFMHLDSINPVYQSITPIFPSAHWLEREIRDMLGIVPLGHPDPRRLVSHPDWPQGVFPMRKDFLPGTRVPRTEGEMEFCQVEGEGVYQIPVGPVHAGIIEPGHFRFFTFGEDVINLQAQLFYTHRGVEKAAESLNFNRVVLVAERICGVCSASHAAAYCQAVESLVEAAVPQRALYIRTIFLEMERLYNHVGDIGNMCAGVGFSYGISRGAILKERLMRMNMRLAGHRYLRGIIIPGGVSRELGEALDICRDLVHLEKDLQELTEVLLSSSSLLDRMQTTGVLQPEAALDLGAVGPAARASGVDWDLRRDLTYAAYDSIEFNVPVQSQGDVFARMLQRVEESSQSFHILRQAFKGLPPGELRADIPELPAYKTSVGYTESARGANVHWIMTGPGGMLHRYMVRSASHCNWPVVPLCLPGNIVPDFPLVNKSFELCYACLDR